MGSRAQSLVAVGLAGAEQCGYTVPVARDTDDWQAAQVLAWLRTRCDCKYGMGELGDHGGEETGCPELRSAYLVLSAMSDAEWQATRSRRLPT